MTSVSQVSTSRSVVVAVLGIFVVSALALHAEDTPASDPQPVPVLPPAKMPVRAKPPARKTLVPPPEVPLPVDSISQDAFEPAQEKIRAALEGEASSGGTGDGVLDDVLGMIRRQGSVLKGSSLDPLDDASLEIDGALHADSSTTESQSLDGAQLPASQLQAAPSRSALSRAALAAEQMLKSARLLENIGSANQDRAELVNRMRAEAVKLLTE